MRHRFSLSRLAKACTLLGLVGLAAGGLAACSRSKRPPGTRDASAKLAPMASGARTAEASAVALCSALHELPTRRRAECCAEPPVSVYFDECVRLLSNAVRARTVSIESSKVALCTERVAETTRGCDWVAPTLAAAPAECGAAVTGLVQAGGRCTSSLECTGALHCAGQGATTPGVCRAPQAVGGGCGASVDALATYVGVRVLEERKPQCGEFCDLVTHRCGEKPEEGAACKASVNCAKDQACRNGRCEKIDAASREARSLPGGTCTTDLDCRAGGCVEDESGKRSCAKKCASELASLRGRSPLGSLSFGRNSSARATSRTSKGTGSATP